MGGQNCRQDASENVTQHLAPVLSKKNSSSSCAPYLDILGNENFKQNGSGVSEPQLFAGSFNAVHLGIELLISIFHHLQSDLGGTR